MSSPASIGRNALARNTRLCAAAVLVSCALSVSACTGGTLPSHYASDAGFATGSRILLKDLQQYSDFNTYQVVEWVRPTFLRGRGPASVILEGASSPDVYINGQFAGDAQTLRSLPASQVYELRFLSTTELYHKHGRQNSMGAIEVIMLR